MKIYKSEDVEKSYLGVSYTQQEVDCSGGAAVQPCKNFSSDLPYVYPFLPVHNSIPEKDVKKEIELMVVSAKLLEKAVIAGIPQEEAESAIFPGCRNFYEGPQWLLDEAIKLR